jgi:hypothetical protein
MANRYWVGGSGTWDTLNILNWSTTSGGVGGASVPGSSDIALLDANSGAVTVTLGADATVSRLTCTGFTGTLDFSTYKISLSGSNTTIFTGSNTMSTAGNRLVECTYAGSTGLRVLNTGIMNEATAAISFNIIAGSDSLNGPAYSRNLNFTGFSGTLNQVAKTIYGNLTISSGMILPAGTGTFTFGATSGTQQITTAGKTLDFPLTFNGIGGTFAFQDALTQGSTRAFTITNGTVQLKAGTTNTVGSLVTSGTNQKYLQSTLANTQATLSDASGTNTLTYTTIKDIAATGGATWQAYVTSNNVNAGNNTGWDFYLPTSSIYDSLRLRGYTGTVTDMLLQYFLANGATSNNLADAEIEFLAAKGFTSGTVDDRWYAYLASLSYSGTVTDMKFNYWKDPA